jgi:sortase A
MRSRRYKRDPWRIKVSNILILAGLVVLLWPAGQYAYSRYVQWSIVRDTSPAIITDNPPATDPGEDPGETPYGTVWRIYIPKINLGAALVRGISASQLKKGPGVYPEGVDPGEHGNLCIAGHRNAYGFWFWHLDKVLPGDLIYITVGSTAYVYETQRNFVVAKNDWSVIAPTDYDAVTLTTCHPIGSTEQRLIVRGKLVNVIENYVPVTPR